MHTISNLVRFAEWPDEIMEIIDIKEKHEKYYSNDNNKSRIKKLP